MSLRLLLLSFLFASFYLNALTPVIMTAQGDKTQSDNNTPPSMGNLADGAEQMILVEMDTGRVLAEKNADQPMHPSSLTKIVTVMPVFEGLKTGKINLSDTFTVSERAWRKEGSRMFLNLGETVTLDQLLKGIIIQSGNDATTTLAEGLGGTEEIYAREMTDFAKKMGATSTNFRNASGIPEADHYTTARDMATISRALIARYPEFYALFEEKDYTHNNIRQGNRNPLLYKTALKVDGIKTGNSSDGGYALVASAVQKGMRLILVINGVKSMNERSRLGETMLLWGFREFRKAKVFAAGQVLGQANVWQGAEGQVDIIAPEDINLVLSNNEVSKVKVTLIYSDPIPAPIQAGQQIGTLEINLGDGVTMKYPVVAAKAVGEIGIFGRVFSAIHYLIFGSSK